MASMFKGLFGLLMLFAGIYFIWAALFGTTFWSLLGGIMGFNPTICISYYVFLAILAIPMIWLGARWLFENESGFLRLLVGIGGLFTLVTGLIIGIIGGMATAGLLSVFSFITFIALGLAMIDYGFKLRILPFVDQIIMRIKKLVMMRI